VKNREYIDILRTILSSAMQILECDARFILLHELVRQRGKLGTVVGRPPIVVIPPDHIH
jgi:hypothetical protein